MNAIEITGRLTRDPELRRTTSGTAVCTVSVAVDRGYGDHKATDFFTVVFWKQGAEFVSNYFRKGQMIAVTGEMQSRQYEKDGQKRTSWEIGNAHAEFCGSKADNQQTKNFDNLQSRLYDAPMGGKSDFVEIGDDEDLPF